MLCEAITIKARYLLQWTPTTQPPSLHNIQQTIYRTTWDTIPTILDYCRVLPIKYPHITVITLIVTITIVFRTDFHLIIRTRILIFHPGKILAVRVQWEGEAAGGFQTTPSPHRLTNPRKIMYHGPTVPVVLTTGVPHPTGFSRAPPSPSILAPVPTLPWRIITTIRVTWCCTRTWNRTRAPPTSPLLFTRGWELLVRKPLISVSKLLNKNSELCPKIYTLALACVSFAQMCRTHSVTDSVCVFKYEWKR